MSMYDPDNAQHMAHYHTMRGAMMRAISAPIDPNAHECRYHLKRPFDFEGVVCTVCDRKYPDRGEV